MFYIFYILYIFCCGPHSLTSSITIIFQFSKFSKIRNSGWVGELTVSTSVIRDRKFLSTSAKDADSMAPPWGLSTPTAQKNFFESFLKVSWSRNKCFSYGVAPCFACAKLYTFPMFPACAPAP